MMKMQTVVTILNDKIRSTTAFLLNREGQLVNFSLERPPEAQFGDFASNVALVSVGGAKAANLAKSPREWAEKIVASLEKDEELKKLVKKMTVAGAGFINFYLQPKVKVEQLLTVVETGSPEMVNLGQGRSALVEFSSPNIAKPFTIGHLRSTIIGAAIAKLLEKSGYEVKRDNHLGDWGTQFGKQLVALEKWGNWAEIEASPEPIKKLVDLYVRFHEEAERQPELEEEARETFAKLEAGDENCLSIWQKVIDLSMKEFNRIYDQLDIKFSENDGRGYGESFAVRLADAVVEELKEKGLLHESQGAQIVEFAPETKLPPLIIVKKDGASIYATRDLAIDKFRREQYSPDLLVINEVGKEQSLYFRQLYQIEEDLGWYKKGQRIHVAHGLYRFKDKKMSTRKGEVIWLQDVIAAALAKVKELNPDISAKDAEIIALGAIKWNDLSREAINDIDFDLEQMLSLKGNSGAYMQYATVRIKSLLKKSENEHFDGLALWEWWTKTQQSELLVQIGEGEAGWSTDEMSLLSKLNDFGRVMARATENLAPHWLATYLYELAQEFNNFYDQGKIAGNLRRLTLTKATEINLTVGLSILGIQTPDKM